MAIMMGDLRTALIDAGASEDLANKAATEVATYESRLASIETRLSLLTWMSGVTLGLVLLVLSSTLALWTKFGEVTGQLTQIAHSLH